MTLAGRLKYCHLEAGADLTPKVAALRGRLLVDWCGCFQPWGPAPLHFFHDSHWKSVFRFGDEPLLLLHTITAKAANPYTVSQSLIIVTPGIVVHFKGSVHS